MVLYILASFQTQAQDLFNLLLKLRFFCKDDEDFCLDILLAEDFLVGADVCGYSGLKRSIVMELLYLKGTLYSFFGLSSIFSGLFSREFKRSLSKTVKWIFFLDFERLFSSDLDIEPLYQTRLLWARFQGIECFFGEGKTSDSFPRRWSVLFLQTSFMHPIPQNLNLVLEGRRTILLDLSLRGLLNLGGDALLGEVFILRSCYRSGDAGIYVFMFRFIFIRF